MTICCKCNEDIHLEIDVELRRAGRCIMIEEETGISAINKNAGVLDVFSKQRFSSGKQNRKRKKKKQSLRDYRKEQKKEKQQNQGTSQNHHINFFFLP